MILSQLSGAWLPVGLGKPGPQDLPAQSSCQSDPVSGARGLSLPSESPDSTALDFSLCLRPPTLSGRGCMAVHLRNHLCLATVAPSISLPWHLPCLSSPTAVCCSQALGTHGEPVAYPPGSR
ncbi:DAND5 [Ovibos moschatus]